MSDSIQDQLSPEDAEAILKRGFYAKDDLDKEPQDDPRIQGLTILAHKWELDAEYTTGRYAEALRSCAADLRERLEEMRGTWTETTIVGLVDE